ncbi:MAG: carboxylating nicotinate-nucleotide diphosphorylase [Ignisphaera sp.]
MEGVAIDRLLQFLKDDLFFIDVTTEAMIPKNCRARAIVVAEDRGIVAGNNFVVPFLKYFNIEVIRYVEDGGYIDTGDIVLELMGEARKILSIERTILNFLMILSGIATYTKSIVERVRKINSKLIIAATRKTHPGLAFFEKYAVSVGGGSTHRLGLFDMVLIKDNHLAIVGDVRKAVELARKTLGYFKKIEVEVRSAEEALEAARAGADIVMLDNMSVEEVAKAIELLRLHGVRDRVLIEVSGGIDEDSIAEYAKLDVDIVSLSKLTLEAPPLKMSMDVVEVIL